ncbi:WYL domain-containing protein [Clostridium sp. OS1-26]|uniref:helix-turn-helix transcriptional regulator n=1 Tax=Clostridium sp. OS1-26 TaxID=3070681 RepID=UPI0027DF4D57|nr:WYL domain-containing protein [Clostridium sp. OS1-26]WML32982.1 WYL domain-containing protein [Clostridium sp. OS1-26]
MFSDFIKHYNIIRTILRDLFLYGCFSREELEGKRKISSRKISYEIRRIQQYIEEEYIRIDRDGRYKLLALTYDSIRNTENFLVKTYMTKSFTRTDLILYFCLFGTLYAQDKPCCFREIEDTLIEDGLISYDNISSKTIERKLNEMCTSLGILDCETVKRTKHYSISRDIFEVFDDQEVIELLTAVSLFKNTLFPVSAGYYCEDNLKDYILYERKIKLDFADYFQYRNLHFHPVIEEEILWKLLNAMQERKCIRLNYKLPPNRSIDNPKEFLRPFKVRYDIQCGRFYLVSYDNRNKCVISRLDRIEDIEVYNSTYEAEGLKELYERDMKYSWSSVPLGQGKKTENIKIEIIIDESKEKYIIEKIQSEVQEGAIERIEEGLYHLTMTVNDSGEMVPWIRSYSGYMKVIQGRHLAKRLTEDWREMLENYGTF